MGAGRRNGGLAWWLLSRVAAWPERWVGRASLAGALLGEPGTGSALVEEAAGRFQDPLPVRRSEGSGADERLRAARDLLDVPAGPLRVARFQGTPRCFGGSQQRRAVRVRQHLGVEEALDEE